MPKWYRLNGSGSWTPTNSIYRLNGSGVWTKIKTIYRLNGSGSWGVVHSSQEAPSATTSPTLTNQNSTTDLFYGGDTLTLTRGAYTNTTSNSDTTYRMRIYKGTNASLALNATNWTVAAEANYTGSNSTSSTTLTYSLTDTDAKDGYYLVGEVRVNNDANTSGSSDYDFETASRVLSRISFTVTNLTVTPTDRGGTFSWTVGGVANSTFIHSQTLTVRLTGPSGTVKSTASVVPGTTTAVISDATNISPSTLYYATIEVIANDGWKSTATPNKLSDDEYFNTLSASPVNTVAPTIGPLNNRGYLPVSTTLTATQGTWSNVNANTSYSYNWVRVDNEDFLVTTGFISSNTRSYSLADVGDSLYVTVRATNLDGGIGTATSPTYVLDQAVAVSNVTPTTATLNIATNFSFNISHYPTSYVVNWGDGTSNSYNVSANTSTVNATIAKTYSTTGTKTITVTAQPGNKSSSTNITVSAPAPTASSFAQSDVTTTPSQPSTISFSSSNNQVTSTWTNGSPITSVTYTYSGAGTNGSVTDTTSPFVTSDVTAYSQSGTYTFTVTNFNNNLVARVSWNQTNAQSYRIFYSSSVFGSETWDGNSSASTVTVDIPWSTSSGSFTFTGLTVYSSTSQSGTSSSYSTGFSAISINTKSSSRSGSTSLTYSLPKLATPTGVSASDNRTDGINVTWNAVSGAAYYGVWYGPPAPSYNSTPDFQNITSTSYLDSSMGAGVTRDYYVQAFRSGNPANTKSDWGGPDSGTRVVQQHTVTWNANGGSVSPSSSTVNAGSSVTAPTPTRSGYTFNGWYNQSSGGSFVVSAGGSYTPSSSITLYAQWTTSGGGIPAVPTGVSACQTGSGTQITWNAVSGATSYGLWYQSSSSPYTGTGEDYSTTGTSFTVAITTGFYWSVRAKNSSGNSAYSSPDFGGDSCPI